MATPRIPDRRQTASATSQPEGAAQRFGALVRERRETLGMRQDEVALATGVGRRFVIDLEAGKATCQLGKSLVVAEAVGLRLFDLLAAVDRSGEPQLPDMIDDPGDDLPDVAENDEADG